MNTSTTLFRFAAPLGMALLAGGCAGTGGASSSYDDYYPNATYNTAPMQSAYQPVYANGQQVFINGQPIYSDASGQWVFANGQVVYPNGQRVYSSPTGYPVSQPMYAPQPVYTANAYGPADDYIYYPADEVYYRTSTGNYIYQAGGHWVHRHDRPLFLNREGPSVHVELSAGPERQNDEVVRRYPRGWTTLHRRHDSDDDAR